MHVLFDALAYTLYCHTLDGNTRSAVRSDKTCNCHQWQRSLEDISLQCLLDLLLCSIKKSYHHKRKLGISTQCNYSVGQQDNDLGGSARGEVYLLTHNHLAI